LDKRSNNGGHSTKSKGVDKRKNPYRNVITDAVSDSDIDKILNMLKDEAIKEKDKNAAKLVLEYCLGKPKQSIEQTNVNIDQEVTIDDIKKIREEFFKKY